MATHLVSYALTGAENKAMQKRLHEYADGSVEHHRQYDKHHLIESGFIDRHSDLFESGMGEGFWSWPPYILLNAMDGASDGDLFIYCDIEYALDAAGIAFIKSHAANGYFLVEGKLLNAYHTKRDCFHLMGCDDEVMHNARQIMRNCCAFVKSKGTADFLAEWLKWNTMFDVISDKPSHHKQEYPDTLMYHNFSQSTLTNLVRKHGLGCVPESEFAGFLKKPQDMAATHKTQAVKKFNKAYY